MVDDYMLDKALDRIKEIIELEKFDDTEILIHADDKLPDDITLKTVMMLMTYVTKDDDKFYPPVLLEEAFFFK